MTAEPEPELSVTAAPPPPARVRVTAPRNAPASADPNSVSRELDEQTEVGELFIGSLIRSQLRLAMVVAGGFLLILLGAGVYPLVIICGALYVRSASRNEQRFLDLVDDE